MTDESLLDNFDSNDEEVDETFDDNSQSQSNWVPVIEKKKKHTFKKTTS